MPWAADDKQLDVLWRQSVMNDWLRLKLAGKKPDDIRKTLDKRYVALADSVKQLKGEDVFQFFVNAYTNAVDPHTDYFTRARPRRSTSRCRCRWKALARSCRNRTTWW